MKDELDRVLLTVDSDSIPQVSELYEEARRIALRVDESLDNVLDQLGRMDVYLRHAPDGHPAFHPG